VVVDALSRSEVPKVALPLIADLDRLGIALCFVGTASEETRMLIQSSLMERVRAAQQQDHLLQEAQKRVGDGKPQSSPLMRMIWFVLGAAFVCLRNQR
jgi:hypothetical protein